MQKLLKLFKWIDNNLLKILVIGFIFLIPLYPKFPLKTIEYTYVAIRLEDLYIGIVGIVYAIQLFRKKETLNRRYFILFALFWAAVVLSYLFAIYVEKNILFKQVGLLHTVRRIEYMSIFFVALSTIRDKKDAFRYFFIMSFVAALVCLYALGQKYLGWPAIQTMNPAFARGMILYLTPEARVSSTFAGHYDLAAYLVLLMPLILGLFFRAKKFILFIVFFLSLIVLVLTASRVSFIAYVVSITLFLLYRRQFKYFIIIAILTGVASLMSTNLVNRFMKTVQIKQIFVNNETGQVLVPQKISSKELPAGTSYIAIDKPIDTVVEAKNKLLVQEQIINTMRKEASKSGKILTATEEADLAASVTARLRPVNTYITDISSSTRFDIEWPRAINAFKKNPLLGTGPSSITEATDNDYLRWIGEFGALGTFLFLNIIGTIAYSVWKKARSLKKPHDFVYYGFLFGLFGLMINASYIDVFEASKVAFTFWMLAGIMIGLLQVDKETV